MAFTSFPFSKQPCRILITPVNKITHPLLRAHNNRRKAKAWLPKQYLNQAKDLKTGEFLHQYGSRITLEKVPLFQSRTKPRPYMETKKRNLIVRMIRALVGT